MLPALVVLSAFFVVALTLRFPLGATVVWMLVLETSPDAWLDAMIGGHEVIIGIMKGFGVLLVLAVGLRMGWRQDRFNPGYAFGLMFLVGLVHGLYPTLSVLESVRSLIGSAGPFLFSFVRLPGRMIQGIIRAAIWGPLFTVGFGAVLALTGLDQMYAFQQGALRLGASGEAPFLAGFGLIGVYATLMELARSGARKDAAMLVVNLIIILLTGARTPLALAVLVTLATLIAQRRIFGLAAFGAVAAFGVMFLSALTFIRVIDLAQLGEAADLSNRDLVWPYFFAAFQQSPLFGWGVGAGKVIIPVTSHLSALIGTNAAHDEFLRIGSEGGVLGVAVLLGLMVAWVARGSAGLMPAQAWLMRLVFFAFALHSATDNTLIATTSSAFFIWVSAVFATGEAA